MRRRGTRHDVVLQRRTRCDLARRARPRAACRNTAGTTSSRPARTPRGAAQRKPPATFYEPLSPTRRAQFRRQRQCMLIVTDVGVGPQLVLPVGVAAPLAEHAHAHIIVAARGAQGVRAAPAPRQRLHLHGDSADALPTSAPGHIGRTHSRSGGGYLPHMRVLKYLHAGSCGLTSPGSTGGL